MTINKKVKQYLEKKGIKQTTVAKAIRMKPVTLNAILNGRAEMRVDTLVKICSFLEMDTGIFLQVDSN